VLATAEAASGMTPGSHGSTFGGNPLAIAAANAVLDVMLKPGFFDHVQRMSLLLKQKLASVVDRYPAARSRLDTRVEKTLRLEAKIGKSQVDQRPCEQPRSHQQHAPPGRRQRGGEIDRGGRLADASLLVHYGDCSHRESFPWSDPMDSLLPPPGGTEYNRTAGTAKDEFPAANPLRHSSW
jgi:hypothetical protein